MTLPQRIWLPALLCAVLFAAQAYDPLSIGVPGDLGRRRLDQLLAAGLWLSGAWLSSRLVGALVWDRLATNGAVPAVPRLVRDTVSIAIFTAAAAGIVAYVFEQPLTGFFAATSVLALVIGFALRSIILDIFTGLAVNADRSYGVGDWIEVHHRDFKQAVFGRVADINWRTTRVALENGNVVVIPNNVMSMGMTTNFTAPSRLSRFELSLTLDRSVPPSRAQRLLLGTLLRAVGAKGPEAEPTPQVLIGDVDATGVTYLLRYSIDVDRVSPSTARGTVWAAVVDDLDVMGIAPALPKEAVQVLRVAGPTEDARAVTALKLLRRIDFVAGSLDEPELQALASRAATRRFEAGGDLMRQGEPGRSMFVLADGAVEVLLLDDHDAERRVARLSVGAVVGEMSLLTRGTRSATVRALTEVTAFEVFDTDIAPLIAARPAMAEHLSWLVAARRVQLEQAGRPEEAREAATVRLSAQILDRMRSFFRGLSEERRAG